jgi:hypothetical protein
VLVLAGLALPACETHVRFLPQPPEWTAGEGVGRWSSGDVEVTANLVAAHEARFPISGEVRFPAASEIAFVPEINLANGAVGELRRDGGRTSAIEANVLHPMGDATAVGFALRPDIAWSGTPVSGTTVSYTIVVRSGAAEVRCPFRFAVDVDGPRLTTLGWIAAGGAAVTFVTVLAIGATGYFVITAW